MVLRKFGVTVLGGLLLITACSNDSNNELKEPTTPALEISATPVLHAEEDQNIDFWVSTKNAVGEVHFEILNGPQWLTIDQYGHVTGIALTNADAGIFEEITIVAKDDNHQAQLQPFTLTVVAVNDDPVLSFSQSRYLLDSGADIQIAFQAYDEEGDEFELFFSSDGLLSLILEDGYIKGEAHTVNKVISDQFQLRLVSDSLEVTQTISVSVHPVSDNGVVQTIVGSPTDHGIHLIVVGDGYQESEFALLQKDVLDFIDLMHSDLGIAQHMENWQVHVIKAFSNESGADLNYGDDTVDTYFGSGYNCSDIERLVCADVSKVNSLIMREFPKADHALMIVNSEKYGGSGGQIAIYARSAPEIALHELGHSFAYLADEYIDENLAGQAAASYWEGKYANVTNTNDPYTATWAQWIDSKEDFPSVEGQPGVGIFEGSLYNATGFYRPMSRSRMSTNFADFGPVSSEQWVLSIYQRTGVVTQTMPTEETIELDAGTAQEFSVETVYSQEIQGIKWFINDIEQVPYNDERRINFTKPTGNYTLRVEVSDKTGKVRKQNGGADFTFQWQITVR